MENSCPCFSGKEYQECCKPFHQGKMTENALLLMRSRFAAYALNLPEYIIATTHPASMQYPDNKFSWKKSISQFSKTTAFRNLEILDFKERDTLAIVTFTAYIEQGDQDATFTEKSHFEKKEGRWLYKGGKIAQGKDLNLITEDQLRVLPLAYYGDPILRRKAEEILEITPSIKQLIEGMVETMCIYEGIGLAAPQVHQSLRLFVIRKPILIGENKYKPGDIKVFINPVLSEFSKETWNAPEGCLSIPTIRFQVERPTEVTVEYTNLNGERMQERVTDWEARVIMHEFDHIEGIFFIDRLNPKEQAKLKQAIKNVKRRIHS